MLEQFVIEGNHHLEGEVTVSGNKNAALKMLPACLLTDEPVTLNNVPDIADVRVTLDLLRSLGAEVEVIERNQVRVQAKEITRYALDRELSQRTRASIVFAGPMLARARQLELPPPGGDVIGRRRLDTHVLALQSLGAQVDFDGVFKMRTSGLRGADILLDEASVTATENTLMAAVLAEGTTIIRNAASEPHVQELQRMLVGMGAQIDGIGSNVVTIRGTDALHGGEFDLAPDHIEIASVAAIGAITRGALTVEDVVPEHLHMITRVLARLGVQLYLNGTTLFLPVHDRLELSQREEDLDVSIETSPWPGFPSDLVAIATLIATQAHGTTLIHEKLFNNRLLFVDKLTSMGAQIVLCDPHRALVVGPTPLRGEYLDTPDVRTGLALLGAALCSQGSVIIDSAELIDRTFENVVSKLVGLGAQIEVVRS